MPINKKSRQLTLMDFIKSKGRELVPAGSGIASSEKPSNNVENLVKTRNSTSREVAVVGGFGEPLKLLLLSSLEFKISPKEAVEGLEYYLLSTYYDGDRRVIVMKLYSEDDGEVYEVPDRTGYLPYFLTDIPPDKLQMIKDVVRHPGFDHVEVEEKFDLLRWQKRRVTKIVVKTPDVVRVLRDKVPRAWEAHIKFHHNYIYDKQLIPGMKYKVEKGKLIPVTPHVPASEYEYVRSLFESEDPSTLKMALEWLPLFESPPPRIRKLAVDVEVFTPFRGRVPNPEDASYPVISIAMTSDDGLKCVFVLARGATSREEGALQLEVGVELKGTHIEVFDSERAMILEALRVISNYPLLVTFNGDNFDLPYLYNRALKLGVPKSVIPFRITRDYVTLKAGFHVDLYKFFSIKAIQSYAFGGAYKEYTLDAIAQALLGERKIQIEVSVSELSLEELIAYNLRDAVLTLKLLTFNGELVWHLMVLLMRISKLPLEDAVRSQVSAWIKSLLYWEHRKRGYLIPTQEEIVKLKGAAKSEALVKGKKYQGAIVLDPPSGVFFDVVVLDFASLYPSIIKLWNLSYETINPIYCPEGKVVEVPDVGHKVCMSIPGLTAQIVGLLRDYRVKLYKRKAKDSSLPPEKRAWYDTVQAAMKVYINASYGVFGASNFPLYAPPLAESVTAIGRYTIKETIRKARELGLYVLYGDTDSLFLWNPDRESLKKLQEYVSQKFGLELEVDKEYRYVAFSGLKKNYIGVYHDGTVEVKGLVAKKRNTPEFLKKEFKEILNMFSSVRSAEEFIKVREKVKENIKAIYSKLKNYEYTLDELAIKVGLSKPLEEYTKSTPPHVKAARQLKAIGIEVLPGDIISFVKVKCREGVKPVQLARLFEVDVEKYVEYVKSGFEQILSALDMSWDDIVGSKKLESFLMRW